MRILSQGSRVLEHPASTERVSTGAPDLDEMMSGGWFRGSTILISGSPGTAKSTLTASFLAAACERGERALSVSFDESPATSVRNLRSVGIDLQRHLDSGLLRMHGLQARLENPDLRVARIQALIEEHDPQCFAVDPISGLAELGESGEADEALLRLVELCKRRGTTTLFTSLLAGANPEIEDTAAGISTLADTWIHLAYVIQAGERNRSLTIIKSRGTRHSDQVREMLLSEEGLRLLEVYNSGGAVLMGTLRWEREAQERSAATEREQQNERRQFEAEIALSEAQGQLRTLEKQVALRRLELERLAQSYQDAETYEKARREGTRRRRTGAGPAEDPGAPQIRPEEGRREGVDGREDGER